MSTRVIGLMSGTSLDGIDAALVRFDGPLHDLAWSLEAFVSHAYDGVRREQIQQAIEKGDAPSLCRLHARLGEWLAEAALAVCARAGVAPAAIDLIGSHGQTVWHEPPTPDERGATLQLGCAATIAERTGIDVVSDFRTRFARFSRAAASSAASRTPAASTSSPPSPATSTRART